ncbi:MAG: hypothetical protein IJI73_11615 [Kiritimatiellae bacterium]|nr:hypothetical protein [Kiritimatiellia bacterium]
MKNTIKFGLAALAVTAAASTFAGSSETKAEEADGWTPIAIGLATPVQLPWGLNRWDVYGLDLNVFYSDAPKMYGLDVGGLAAVTRDDMMGLQVSGLFNFGLADVYGLRATLGLNMCRGSVYGCDLGLIGFRNKIVGFDAEFLGSAQQEMYGLQIGGLANVSSVESYGCSIAGICNVAKSMHGLQASFIFNMTEELHGCQIALVNYTKYCDNGFQIGLVNIILQNRLKVLPIVNGYF